MERDSFDRFVRLFGTARSRRDALRLVAAGALVGGAATMEDAAAKRRRRNRNNRTRSSVRAQAVGQCQPQGCRPGIDCTGKTIGPGTNLARCAFTGEFFFPPANLNLGGANLSRAVFLSVEFFGQPSFRGANASNTCFNGSTLDFADFRGANLRGASFLDVDLRGADFRGSNVTADQLACGFVGCDTILPNGQPAVACTGGQVCCGAVCCDPGQCEDDTCLEETAP